MIYFIKAEETNYVKIGYTFDNLQKLISKIQSDCPHKLSILKLIEDGDPGLERKIQERFIEDNIHGKWYNFSPEMLTFEVDESSSPMKLIEGLIKEGIFPSRKNIQSRYPGFYDSLINKYRPQIKDLTLRHFGCTQEKVFVTLKKIKELSTTFDIPSVKRKLGISDQAFRYYEESYKKYLKTAEGI